MEQYGKFDSDMPSSSNKERSKERKHEKRQRSKTQTSQRRKQKEGTPPKFTMISALFWNIRGVRLEKKHFIDSKN